MKILKILILTVQLNNLHRSLPIHMTLLMWLILKNPSGQNGMNFLTEVKDFISLLLGIKMNLNFLLLDYGWMLQAPVLLEWIHSQISKSLLWLLWWLIKKKMDKLFLEISLLLVCITQTKQLKWPWILALIMIPQVFVNNVILVSSWMPVNAKSVWLTVLPVKVQICVMNVMNSTSCIQICTVLHVRINV